jgi:hypothetical protein
MKMTCISCNSMSRIEGSIINPTGSLIRCTKCSFIFIVHSHGFNEQPKTQDTNIDQSLLDDIYCMEHAVSNDLPFHVINEEWNNFFTQGALSIDDFNENGAENLIQILLMLTAEICLIFLSTRT